MGVLARLVQTEPDESPVYQGIAEHASRDEAVCDQIKPNFSTMLILQFHQNLLAWALHVC